MMNPAALDPTVMQQLPQLMTPQQKQEQFQAIQQKLAMKSSLKESCEKHQG
jgi:hypothetical protein